MITKPVCKTIQKLMLVFYLEFHVQKKDYVTSFELLLLKKVLRQTEEQNSRKGD
ncbi:hypothetical protein J6590_060039 [Homalodisca vitripennis]|nr:hypothetical protein J6590_060039 [Homalodisca vitripennis]